MKNFFGRLSALLTILVVFFLVMILAPQRAAASGEANAPVLLTPNGSRVDPVAAQNLSYIGAPVYRIETSTPADQAVLLLSGSGLLYGIRCSSGSTGAYAMAFDSASASGITVATIGKAIAGPVYSAGQVSVSGSTQTVILGNDQGLNASADPLPFTNGLVGIAHGSVLNCTFQARLKAGNNPGP